MPVTTDQREVAQERTVPDLRPLTAGRRRHKLATSVSTGALLVRTWLPLLTLLLAAAVALLASHRHHPPLLARVVSVGLGIFLAMAAGTALVRIRLLRRTGPPGTPEAPEAPEVHGTQVDGRATGPSLQLVSRLHRQERYGTPRLALIRTVLVLAVSTSLLWLTGHRPGPWEDFLVVALAIACVAPFVARKVPFIKQRSFATRWGAGAGHISSPSWWTTACLRASLWCAAVLLLLSRVPTYWAYLAYTGLTLVLGAVCWTTLVWMLDAWRHPHSFAETGFAATDLNPRYSFSLIVPARHEENVLDRTLLRLVETDYPTFEVLVVVGHDDHGTREVAEGVASLHPNQIRVITDDSWPKNKPKALNAALPHCRGDITGVFDAEDQVHPALIRRVDQCFQKTDADAVQAGVQLMNFRSSWFAVRNVLEYYFWFRSRLHFHARAGFVPLGGNTVFLRTQLLREAGGWDEECLAEDCELGVRISSLGKKVVVFYEPELVTREETPPTLSAFARQRTRWNQGFLQTLRRGYWRRLGLRQRALGLYTLAMPTLLAFAGILIPIAMLTAFAVKAPVPLTLIAFLPAIPMVTVVGVEVVGLGEFCRAYGERASMRDYARLVLATPLYQGVLGFAAARAFAREALGARGWEKTAHFGLHLLPTGHNGKPAGGGSSLPSLALVGGGTLAARSRTVTPYVVAGPMHRAGLRPADTRRVSPGETGPSAFYPGNHRTWADRVAMPGGVTSPGTNDHGPSCPSTRTVRTTGHAWQRGSTVARRETGPSRKLVPSTDKVNTLGRTLPALTLPVGPASATLGDERSADASRRRSRRASWKRHLRAHIDLAIQIPLLTFVGLVQATNMLHWPGTVFDEGTYVANAWAVQTNGVLSNYTFSYGHPPLAWLEVSLWTWANGLFRHTVYSIDVARELMAVLTVISCALLYTLARRLGLHRVFAVAAVILFALCPLGLWFHRLVLLDNVAVCWVLAAFVLALSPRRSVWTFAASGACFAASFLSKETILVLLPVLFLAAAYNTDGRRRRYCLTLFVSFFVLISLAYPLYAALKGELLPGRGHVSLIGYMFVQLFSRKTSGSIFNPQSGTSAFVHFWLQLDPWLLGVALLLTPIALARRSTRAIALAYLVQLAVILRPGYLPQMYVIALLPFAALIVAGSADALWRVAVERWSRHSSTDWRAWWASAGLAPIVRCSAAAALIALVAACAIRVVPRWERTDHQAITTRLDGPERAAQQWVLHHIDRQEHIIVSDDFWIYLIAHGYDAEPVKGGFYSKTVVFYWPLDYDPAVKKAFPDGWRDFDYVISTFGMRNDASQVPTAALALQHSRVVASFGAAEGVIQVRKIDRKPGYGPASPNNPLPVCPPPPLPREPGCD